MHQVTPCVSLAPSLRRALVIRRKEPWRGVLCCWHKLCLSLMFHHTQKFTHIFIILVHNMAFLECTFY